MIDKILQWIDRAKSRVYMTYALWLIVIFSPVLFFALFVDQNLLYQSKGLLKNEYIALHYLNFKEWWGWSYLIGGAFLAGCLTRLTIWDFPKLFVNRAFKKEIEYSTERDITRMKASQKVEIEKNKLANDELETTMKQVEVVEQKEKLESKAEDTWGNDYAKFRKNDAYRLFTILKDALYLRGGNIAEYDEYGNKISEVPSGLVAYLDANNLANIAKGTITLTEKGKYFMKRYLDDEPDKTTGF